VKLPADHCGDSATFKNWKPAVRIWPTNGPATEFAEVPIGKPVSHTRTRRPRLGSSAWWNSPAGISPQFRQFPFDGPVTRKHLGNRCDIPRLAENLRNPAITPFGVRP
jgi:hypothetical protein